MLIVQHSLSLCFDIVLFVQGVVHESEEENVHLKQEKQLLEAKLQDATEQRNQQTINDEQVLAVVEQKAQEWHVSMACGDKLMFFNCTDR